MKKLVVLTGAGISAESGLATFRDSNGLWENHSIYDVATPEAWEKNPELVQRFYNARRKQLFEVEPNSAHKALANLQAEYGVSIITQNVDDLHERGGSNQVLHLHGELKKSRSEFNPNLVYDIEGWELKMGDTCEEGHQLRPNIVWFGEAVPNIITAEDIVKTADILLIIGTSLNVYPAAGLYSFVGKDVPIFLIDPAEIGDQINHSNITIIQKSATKGMVEFIEELQKLK